jgi:hypothetical protein
MPSAVEVPCPNCEKVLKVPESVFGKKIKCKDCGHPFVVKDPNAPKATGPTKPGGPSKPGGGAVKAKKEEPKEDPKPAPAPYKFQDDDDEGAKPSALGVVDEGLDVARCPFCAKELEPPDAVVCVHCGFNNVTRVRAESKKVWAPDANDWMKHLGPGVLALIGCIALIVLDVICYANMREWLTGSFLQKDDKDAQGEIAFYVKPGAFITFIICATILPIIGLGRFAFKRLAVEYRPTEKLKA